MELHHEFQRGLHAAAVVLACALLGSSCVISPVDGREVARRSTPVPIDLVFNKDQTPGAIGRSVGYTFYHDNGTTYGGLCCFDAQTTDLTTDASGNRWVEMKPGNMLIPIEAWLPNTDASHPRAKWKLRIRFYYAGVLPDRNGTHAGPYNDMFMFAGNPDGSFTTSTANCMQQFSSSGIQIATNCNDGTIATIYALSD